MLDKTLSLKRQNGIVIFKIISKLKKQRIMSNDIASINFY